MSIRFHLDKTDGKARLGRLETTHGVVETPVFMPVGTQGTVKGLTSAQLEEAGASIILGNTYHLTLRPGDALIAELGGLHRFMGWHRPILTDSGGFQVFSLALRRRISDDGIRFQSHIDGAELELSPERAVEIQENLGSDIAMCLDECPSSDATPEEMRTALRRTLAWAERCRCAQKRADQALFGIVQGGVDLKLRAECAAALVKLDFPGYALGGFSVGEPAEMMHAALGPCADFLPVERPRYLMGVGRPQDLVVGIREGIDMFDCVMPTRNGRNAQAFTRDGPIRLRNSQHRRDPGPVESDCGCYTCVHFSRAYLHHLFAADEMLGPILLSLHNVAFYCRLMSEARQAIRTGGFTSFAAVHLARWGETL
ncbi:MAG: tRNA guanosine(34) transglycosylase Tgt [Gemmataceae bacterium]